MDMNFAYLILAHQNPEQLYRLVQALDIDESKFIIHIDAKVEISPFIKLFENYTPGRIFICPGRKNIDWGSYTMVEATMAMLHFLFQLELKVDYVHLISGQDYPVKSNEEIVNFFKNQRGKNFIESFTLPDSRWRERGLLRINYKWGINEHKNIFYNDLDYKEAYPPLPHLPEGIIPYGGSQWWSLHIDCVRFIMEEFDRDSDLFQFYRYTFIPDEMLFQTLIMNSHFKDTVVNDNSRFIKWSNGSWHPETIGLEHLKDLMTKRKLFARKFEYDDDKTVLNQLDEIRNCNFHKTDKRANQKSILDTRLEKIANVLILNASFIDNLGLLNGKMGIAIFFYQYADYTRNKLYEQYAAELVDEICAEISTETPIDFANGLTGIGWGVEYLVQKGFIKADTDEILEEIDHAVYAATMQVPFSFQNLTTLFEFGLFYIARLKGGLQSEDSPGIKKKREMLIYMMDELEKLFIKSRPHNSEISQLTLPLVNSFLWFILQTIDLGLSPKKRQTLILRLIQYLDKTKVATSDSVDLSIFNHLISDLKTRISEKEFKFKFEDFTEMILSFNRLCNETEDNLVSEFMKSGCNSLIYSIIHKDIFGESYIETFAGALYNENQRHQLEHSEENNLSLNGGLAGFGFAMINIYS
jgi:hypothetical protein